VTVPWDEATERACGLDVLRHAIAPGCGFGRAAQARERSFGPGDEEAASAAAAQVCAIALAAGRERLERFRKVLAAVPDPATPLLRAGAGEVLEDPDFFDLVRFFETLRELRAAGVSGALAVPDVDAALEAALAHGRTGNGFYLADAFDPALAAARGVAAQCQAAFAVARSRLAERAAAALGREQLRDGEFVVMRDAAPQPLPAEIRVLRETPAYLLCELSLDEAALESLAARDAAVAAVAVAEEAVRAELSRTVAAAAPGLEAACEQLGRLDLLAAKAAFTATYGGTVPHFVTAEARAKTIAPAESSAETIAPAEASAKTIAPEHLAETIATAEVSAEMIAGAEASAKAVAFAEAVYPPLSGALAARGRRYVPLTLELDGLGVVTGPNMGGKTAALRTLGFAFACAALGVPVPARSARLPLAAEIVWLGVGAAEPEANADPGLLSSFGAEVIALKTLLTRPGRPLLVLLDEFARTTSPREGRALLVALLATLRERGAFGLAATHLDGVAAAAGVAHFTSGRRRPASGAVPMPQSASTAAAVAATSGEFEAIGRASSRGTGALAGSLGSGRARTLDVALRELASEMDYTLLPGPEDAAHGSGALELAAALGLDAALLERAAAALRATGSTSAPSVLDWRPFPDPRSGE
jgi:hypothetical protein